ncbi:MAG TPA: cyclic nucleotide-binding domain-containing protein [Sandaracinaceae bacterium]
MRRCVAVLAADPGQLGALDLLARCVAERRGELAARVAARLVDAYVRRGDLPRALAAADLAKAGGTDAKPLHRAIAAAFGAGSKRVREDVAPAPPPLPVREVEPVRASGAKLLAQAERALEAYLASEDEVAENAPVPKLPLFGALSPPMLEPLLGAWELRQLDAGERAIEEGAEGRDAFVVVRGTLRAERGRGDAAVILAVLGPGALFGEMALVSDAPRAASVIAEEPVQLLAASRDALEELAKKTPKIGEQLGEFCRARMVSNLMQHSPLLRVVAREERAKLMARFEPRTFEPGDKLVARGKETNGLFLIASGGVRVVGRDTDGDELQVAVLGPGDVVGEISLVLRKAATADVVATHRTVALELTRDQFQGAIKEHPTLLSELYDLATKREDEMRTVVAQEALDVEGMVLL